MHIVKAINTSQPSYKNVFYVSLFIKYIYVLCLNLLNIFVLNSGNQILSFLI